MNELVLEALAINKGAPCLRARILVRTQTSKRAAEVTFQVARRERVKEVGGNHTLHNEFLYTLG